MSLNSSAQLIYDTRHQKGMNREGHWGKGWENGRLGLLLAVLTWESMNFQLVPDTGFLHFRLSRESMVKCVVDLEV